jgi:hypothetical protein
MLVDQTHAATLIPPRPPRSRLHEHFDVSGGGDTKQAKAEKPAKLQHAGVAFATTPLKAHGKPDFIACGCPMHPLQHEVEIEPELKLSDNHNGRFAIAQCDNITTADLAFYLEAAALEEALHRRIKRGFPYAPTCRESGIAVSSSAFERHRVAWG